jgi:hypothetical protein
MGPGSVFDVRENTAFRGVGPVVEHLLRRAAEKTSWHEMMADLERYRLCPAASPRQSVQGARAPEDAEAHILQQGEEAGDRCARRESAHTRLLAPSANV